MGPPINDPATSPNVAAAIAAVMAPFNPRSSNSGAKAAPEGFRDFLPDACPLSFQAEGFLMHHVLHLYRLTSDSDPDPLSVGCLERIAGLDCRCRKPFEMCKPIKAYHPVSAIRITYAGCAQTAYVAVFRSQEHIWRKCIFGRSMR